MAKKNILKFCIFALSLLSIFAAISVHAEEECSEALIRALTEEGLSEQQINTICKKIRLYSSSEIKQFSSSDFKKHTEPEIELSPIEEFARTVVEAFINGDEELLRKLYSPNNRFFLRNLNNYYPDFNSTKVEDYDFDIEGTSANITKFSDRKIQFKLQMVNKGNDEYLWEEIRRVQFYKSYDKKKKTLFDYFSDEEEGDEPEKE